MPRGQSWCWLRSIAENRGYQRSVALEIGDVRLSKTAAAGLSILVSQKLVHKEYGVFRFRPGIHFYCSPPLAQQTQLNTFPRVLFMSASETT